MPACFVRLVKKKLITQPNNVQLYKEGYIYMVSITNSNVLTILTFSLASNKFKLLTFLFLTTSKRYRIYTIYTPKVFFCVFKLNFRIFKFLVLLFFFYISMFFSFLFFFYSLRYKPSITKFSFGSHEQFIAQHNRIKIESIKLYTEQTLWKTSDRV